MTAEMFHVIQNEMLHGLYLSAVRYLSAFFKMLFIFV